MIVRGKMGHIRLGTLPKSKKWNQVVGLIADGAGVESIAAASADAAESALQRASSDEILTHALWLLVQIPLAAREDNFHERLWVLGLDVTAVPSLLDVVVAFTRLIDQQASQRGRRTDLGEIAQHAAAETLATLVGDDLPTLFTPTPAEVQAALGRLGSSRGFRDISRDFFSRLTGRALGYFLSRELSKHVGPGGRFANIDEHTRFKAALDNHCREAARIIEEFSGGWYGKTISSKRAITPEDARRFAHVAFKKVRAELRKRRGADA